MATNLVQPGVRGKLRRLQTGIRARLAGEGLAWLFLAVVAAVFVTLAIDYFFRFPQQGVRAVFMLSALAGALYVLGRYTVVPLMAPLDNENLAILVERRYGQLKDRLISALQFSKLASLDDSFASKAMIERMACEANDLAERFDFQQVIERRSMLRAMGLAGIGVALLVGFSAWQPEIMSKWMQRNILLRNIDWPQETSLIVPRQTFKVLRGDDLVIPVKADLKDGHVAPPHITVYAQYPSLADITQDRIGESATGSGLYVKTFNAVNESFTFWVTGGDDRKDKDHPHAVQVIDPPSLLDAKFQVYYHDYVNISKPAEFKGSQGGLAARVGSTIVMTAVANKDIQSAEMSYNGKLVGKMEIGMIAGDKGPAHPRFLTGKFNTGNENKATVGTLSIRLRDTEGYWNRRGQQYLLQLQPDLPPTVDIKPRGIGPRITARAILPVIINVKDDIGIAAVIPTATGTRKAATLPYGTSQPSSAAAPAPFGEALVDGPRPGLIRNSTEYKEARADIDTQPMGLKPGDTVSVQVTAKDNMPPEFGVRDDASKKFIGGPNKTDSSSIIFQVVEDKDLNEDFVSRLRIVRMDLIQIIKNQAEANTTTAEASAASSAQVTTQARQHLVNSSRTEVGVSADCARALSTLEAIAEEKANNRIGKPDERTEFRANVLDALTAVQDLLGKQIAALNAAGQVGDAAKFREQAQAIMDAQQDISKRLEKIRDFVEKDADRAYMANQVEVIINWSVELQKALEELRNKETENEIGEPVKKEDKPK